jgi:anti-sigma B factor antagonist
VAISRLPRLASVGDNDEFDVASVPHDAGRTIVRVRGELDLSTCAVLQAALDEAPTGDTIIVDLADCTFLDSSAIRVVLTGARDAAEAGGGLSLVVTDPGVLRVLEIANVGARVPVHPTVESATAEQSG